MSQRDVTPQTEAGRALLDKPRRPRGLLAGNGYIDDDVLRGAILDIEAELRASLKPFTRHDRDCEWQRHGDPNDPEFVRWVEAWSEAGSPCSCGLNALIEGSDPASPEDKPNDANRC